MDHIKCFCCNKVVAGQVECDRTSYDGDMVQFWSGSENHQAEIQREVSSRHNTNIQRVCQIFGKFYLFILSLKLRSVIKIVRLLCGYLMILKEVMSLGDL